MSKCSRCPKPAVLEDLGVFFCHGHGRALLLGQESPPTPRRVNAALVGAGLALSLGAVVIARGRR